MVQQGKILGHIVSKNGILTDVDKISVIIKSPKTNPREVQVFMGHSRYYHRFIYKYTKITKPMYALLVIFEYTQ